MHIEKNVCDNIFGTVLGVDGKTKDDYKSRMTLQDMGVRRNLWPKFEERRGIWKLPQAPYAVHPKERREVFDAMSQVKYPRGYAGSLRNKIRPEDTKFLGLKTHDCHVIMQRLLPVVIRKYVKPSVADALVEFSRFFRTLCARELKKEDVRQLQEDIVVILCKLEMIFPPAFFTIMVHLCIHLPEQVLLTGPVHYTWMFSTERQLGAYKRDIKNKRFPEGCIAERYVIHECVTFIDRYLHGDRSQDISHSPQANWNLSVVSSLVKPYGRAPNRGFTQEESCSAHWCVLQHCIEARPFIEEHRAEYCRLYPHAADNEQGIIESFIPHFRTMLHHKTSVLGHRYPRELHILANGIQSLKFYSKCDVNGVKWICKRYDKYRSTQNSGVCCVADDEQYYGVLKAVVELLYEDRMPVHLFMCDWYDSTKAHYDRGLTSLNFRRTVWPENPFMMAVNATQVFYIDDPSRPGWKVVNHVVQRGTYPEETIACTNTKDPSYEVDNPYQEGYACIIPVSEVWIDMGDVPRVDIPIDDEETEDADPDYIEDEDDEVDGFNDDELSLSDVDISEDV